MPKLFKLIDIQPSVYKYKYFYGTIYTKSPEYVHIIHRTSHGFQAGASVGRVLSGHQLGKPSDVWWIMSRNMGSFVFIIHPT